MPPLEPMLQRRSERPTRTVESRARDSNNLISGNLLRLSIHRSGPVMMLLSSIDKIHLHSPLGTGPSISNLRRTTVLNECQHQSTVHAMNHTSIPTTRTSHISRMATFLPHISRVVTRLSFLSQRLHHSDFPVSQQNNRHPPCRHIALFRHHRLSI